MEVVLGWGEPVSPTPEAGRANLASEQDRNLPTLPPAGDVFWPQGSQDQGGVVPRARLWSGDTEGKSLALLLTWLGCAQITAPL